MSLTILEPEKANFVRNWWLDDGKDIHPIKIPIPFLFQWELADPGLWYLEKWMLVRSSCSCVICR